MDVPAANHRDHGSDPLTGSLTESDLSLLLDLISVDESSHQDSSIIQDNSTVKSTVKQNTESIPSSVLPPTPAKSSHKSPHYQSSSPRPSYLNYQAKSAKGIGRQVREQVIDIVSEAIPTESPEDTLTNPLINELPNQVSQNQVSQKSTYPTTSLLEELGLVAADHKANSNQNSSSEIIFPAKSLDNQPLNNINNSPEIAEKINLEQPTNFGESDKTTAKTTAEDLIQAPDISLLQTILTPPEMDRVGASLEDLSERLKRIEDQVYSPELQNKLDNFEAQINDRLNDQTQQNALNELSSNLASLSQGYNNIPLTLKELNQRISKLEENIFDGDKLLTLIQSIWLKLNDQVMAQHTAEITASFVAIIDEVIRQRIKENHAPLSEALAEIIAEIIQIHVNSYPDQIAIAIAPEIATAVKEQSRIDQRAIIEALGPQMGAAIKQQILLERDAMVDALYPVIGNTISKYLTEAIREINQRVENTFSLDGLSRKIRAKLQGVSEAELILRESFRFEIRAIFLIEKYSGLVIVDLQASEYKTSSTPLEAEMIGGMLTAIRSFVSDCLSRDTQFTEVDAIEYGQAKILLEVTGYSYLAVIVEGEPPKDFIQKMRDILGKITQRYEKELKGYDGDPRKVPTEVKTALAILMEYDVNRGKSGGNFNLVYVLGALLLGGLGWFGWQFYQQYQWQQLEQKISSQWQNDSTMALYRLSPKVTAERVILNGYVPNVMLKQQALNLVEQVIRQEHLDLTIDNRLIAMEAPRNPKDTAVEVQRLTQSFNQTLSRTPNFGLRSQFIDGQVILSGTVTDAATAQRISQSFSQVPGVRSVTNTLVMRPVTISTQIYFVEGESDMKLSDLPKLVAVTNFLERYPDYHIKILGSSDPRGDVAANYRLALRRAQSVERELIKRGIAKQRITLIPMVLNASANNNSSPPQGEPVPEWKLRRVEFLVVPPPN
ncbi:MAG: BON domain-containing protein [Pseudanabaenaceae cyanobacterium]